MKALIISPLLAVSAMAETKVVEWDAPFTQLTVTGYRLMERLSADSSRLVAEVDGQTRTVTADYAEGTHTLYAVAVYGLEVSGPSNEVTFTVPPLLPPPVLPPPRNVRVALQSSEDMQAWQNVLVHEESEGHRKFYRAVFLNP